jgi:rubrerythrin
MNRLSIIVVAALALAALPLSAAPATSTKENLLAAFQGESNAHARYVAFATKADQEGYGRVASLFRAAARAEEIHAKNHAEVLKKIGVDAKPELNAPDVKSTRVNVRAAIEGETYERDTMYPKFLEKARQDGNRPAIETFNMAKTAEAEHARLYTAALAGLDGAKGSASEAFYVCTVCGYTTAKLDFEKCPSCFNPKDRYVKVG